MPGRRGARDLKHGARASLLALALPFAASAASPAPLIVGLHAPVQLESPHPYPRGDATRPVVASHRIDHPGATHVVLHFSRFDLAPGDELSVRDDAATTVHRYTGRGFAGQGAFWALVVPGPTAVVELRAGGAGGGFGYVIDGYSHGFAPRLPESICDGDDKRDVACYETSHPVHHARARAVGRLLLCGLAVCTGSLVSCDGHFLTNEHCRQSFCPDISGVQVQFGFERPSCGSGTPDPIAFPAVEDVAFDGPLDYWLVRLDGRPQDSYEPLQLDPRPLVQDERIYIPQHAGGAPRELAIESDRTPGGLCAAEVPRYDNGNGDTDVGYHCDTEGGSSGSPVLAESSHRVVALHHTGSGDQTPSCPWPNAAVRMELIAPRLWPVLPGCSFCDPLPAPATAAASPAGPNAVQVTFDAVPGATSYRVLRSDDACRGPFVEIARVPASPFVDTTVSGRNTYGYTVEALDGTGCRGLATACDDALATGTCTLGPRFAGLEEARSRLGDTCAVELSWSPASGVCSADLVYNVYRSETTGEAPSPATLIAACVGATSYVDIGARPGVGHHYVVRAEDRGGRGTGPCAGGVEDANAVERPARAVAGSPLGAFFDGAEAAPAFALEAPWEVSAAAARSGAASYRTGGDVSYTCAALTTPPLVVTATSRLTFSTRLEAIELDGKAWDGGTVEVSTDGGATWTRLEPATGYPATYDVRSNACNNDRLGGGAYSGDSPGWIDAAVDLGAFAGAEVLLRFRFATDDLVESTAWWIDDVGVSDVAAAECALTPPGEVSAPGRGTPLWLAKRPGGDCLATFEARPEAAGYNVYEGSIGGFHDHGDRPFLCAAATVPLGPGRRSLAFTPGPASHYYLVTAWNGDREDGTEGTSGRGSPPAQSTCPPRNDL